MELNFKTYEKNHNSKSYLHKKSHTQKDMAQKHI